MEEVKFKKKKKLGSYPYFSVVFSNTIALFVIGLFTLLLLQSRRLTQIIRNNIEIQIYLIRISQIVRFPDSEIYYPIVIISLKIMVILKSGLSPMRKQLRNSW